MIFAACNGYEWEKELLGYSSDVLPTPVYLDFETSLRQCLREQPPHWNPYQPPTELGRKLHYWVAKYFVEIDRRRLGLFVAIGTSLDWWHGVDCVVYYGDPPDSNLIRRRKWVTIDVALYDKQRYGGNRAPDKEESKAVKADLLITREDFLLRDLKRFGSCIAAYLQGRIGLHHLRVDPYVYP